MSFLQAKGIKDYLTKIEDTVEDENKNYFNEVIFTAVPQEKRKLPNNVLPSTKNNVLILSLWRQKATRGNTANTKN